MGGPRPGVFAGPPPRTSVLLSKGGARPGTAGQGAAGAPTARPMTSSKGAGYTSAPTRSGSGGMPPSTAGGSAAAGGASSSGSAAARAVEQCEALEERVHQLLEDAAARVAAGDASGGVDAARDAAQREQRLCALLEQSGQGEQISLDLKFAVSLGLAAAYEANQQLGDALAVYNQVLRSRLFPQVRAGSTRKSAVPFFPDTGCWQQRGRRQKEQGCVSALCLLLTRPIVPAHTSHLFIAFFHIVIPSPPPPRHAHPPSTPPFKSLYTGRLAAHKHGGHPFRSAGLRSGCEAVPNGPGHHPARLPPPAPQHHAQHRAGSGTVREVPGGHRQLCGHHAGGWWVGGWVLSAAGVWGACWR